MKRCPTCDQTFDDTQTFCANDGSRLVSDEAHSTFDPMATIMAPPPSTGDIKPPQTFADPTPQTPPWSQPIPQPGAWSDTGGLPYGQQQQQQSPSYTPPASPALPYVPGQAQQNGLAIASLICGALSIIFLCLSAGFLPGIPAIILGVMHLNKIKRDPATYGAKGMALAGIITGAIGTLISIAYWIFIIIVLIAGTVGGR